MPVFQYRLFRNLFWIAPLLVGTLLVDLPLAHSEEHRLLIHKVDHNRYSLKIEVQGVRHPLRVTDWQGAPVEFLFREDGYLRAPLNGRSDLGYVHDVDLIKAGSFPGPYDGEPIIEFQLHEDLASVIRNVDGEYVLALGLDELEGILRMLDPQNEKDFWDKIRGGDGRELLLVQYARADREARAEFAIRVDGVRVPVAFTPEVTGEEAYLPPLLSLEEGRSAALAVHFGVDGKKQEVFGVAELPTVVDDGLAIEASVKLREGVKAFPPIDPERDELENRYWVVGDMRVLRDPDFTREPYLEEELVLRVDEKGPALVNEHGRELKVSLADVSGDGIYAEEGGRRRWLAKKGGELTRTEGMGGAVDYAVNLREGVAISLRSANLSYRWDVVLGGNLSRMDPNNLYVLQFEGRRPSCCWTKIGGKIHRVPITLSSGHGDELELVYDDGAGILEVQYREPDGSLASRIPIGYASAYSSGIRKDDHIAGGLKLAFTVSLDPRIVRTPEEKALTLDLRPLEDDGPFWEGHLGETELAGYPLVRTNAPEKKPPVDLEKEAADARFAERVADIERILKNEAPTRGTIRSLKRLSPGLVAVWSRVKKAFSDYLRPLSRSERRVALKNLEQVFWQFAQEAPLFVEADLRHLDGIQRFQTYLDDQLARYQEAIQHLRTNGGTEPAHRVAVGSLLQAWILLGSERRTSPGLFDQTRSLLRWSAILFLSGLVALSSSIQMDPAQIQEMREALVSDDAAAWRTAAQFALEHLPLSMGSLAAILGISTGELVALLRTRGWARVSLELALEIARSSDGPKIEEVSKLTRAIPGFENGNVGDAKRLAKVLKFMACESSLGRRGLILSPI